MLLPLHTALDIEVDVIVPGRDALQMVRGVILLRTGSGLIVQLAGRLSPSAEPGQRLILDAGRARGLRIKGTLIERSGSLLTLSYGGEVSSDARTSTRFRIGAEVRYHPCTGETSFQRWMEEGVALPPVSQWATARPDAEMGLSGLWMEVPASLTLDDGQLLLALQFPANPRVWRLVGRVARVTPCDTTQGVGVEFLAVEEGALEELVRRALSVP
ncbi:MAG: hypothetical protein JXX28_06265 [Deltaproteobacteria bacterium]|nr:hypothetical protein [Deltaproteobacteria bacterium]